MALLVYTVGVKCRGLNKKETYEVSHVFSLSERTANKVMKQSMYDLIKHNRSHVVRGLSGWDEDWEYEFLNRSSIGVRVVSWLV